MAGTITAVNLPGKGANGATYVGRAWRGVACSPLGNPRAVGARRPDGGVWTAAETIPHYERELRGALDRTVADAEWNGVRLSEQRRAEMRAVMNDLYQRVQRGEDVLVDCHCKGRRGRDADPPCHGDVVAMLVREKIAERPRRRSTAAGER